MSTEVTLWQPSNVHNHAEDMTKGAPSRPPLHHHSIALHQRLNVLQIQLKATKPKPLFLPVEKEVILDKDIQHNERHLRESSFRSCSSAPKRQQLQKHRLEVRQPAVQPLPSKRAHRYNSSCTRFCGTIRRWLLCLQIFFCQQKSLDQLLARQVGEF